MNPEWKKIKTGSVKNIYSHKGDYIFNFSDRYSIFDWGEMPDHLENKGKCLALMADMFFEFFSKPTIWKYSSKAIIPKEWQSDILELLQEKGLSHHCLGLVDEKGENVLSENAQSFLKVKPVNVVEPKKNKNNEYDYSFYVDSPNDCLVPLEVIFRFGTPKGSSLLRRLKKNPEYLSELGLTKMPMEGDVFAKPIIEFSTKLEAADTYLTKPQAFAMVGINELEGKRLYGLAILMAAKLKELFTNIGLELWDGKFEYAFSGGTAEAREFMWVDSLGPDEIRLLKDKAQLSKEYLRQAYEETSWLNAVKEAKEIDKSNFKKLVLNDFPNGPEKLDPFFKNTAEQIYMALTNSLCDEFKRPKLFKNCPSLNDVATAIRKGKR